MKNLGRFYIFCGTNCTAEFTFDTDNTATAKIVIDSYWLSVKHVFAWRNKFLSDVAILPVSKMDLVLQCYMSFLHHFRTYIRIVYQNTTVVNTNVVCKYCDKVFFDENEIKSDALLKKHILEEHPFMNLHQCGLCCFDTTNEIEFNWHLVTFHLNPKSQS